MQMQMKVLKPSSQFIMNEGTSSCLAQLEVFAGLPVGAKRDATAIQRMVGFPTLNSGGITQLMDIMCRTGRLPVSGAHICAGSPKSARTVLCCALN